MKLSQFMRKKDSREQQEIKLVSNSPLFDERWYLTQYSDVFKSGKNAARHYLRNGWKENRNPSESFSTAEYLQTHPECKICPIVFEHNRNSFVDLSICAIMKNEASYVKEWIDYHRLVGVKRFYIYDNESEDNLREVLKPYIEQGIVVYKDHPGEKMQMPSYNDCVENYRDKTEWLAIIDADEFIVPTQKNSIPEFWKDYQYSCGVGINWICFDSNNHKIKPQGGVLENYTRVHYDEQFPTNHHIKSIVRPNMVTVISNPHFAIYAGGRYAVTEKYEQISEAVNHSKFPLAILDKVSVDKIRINHYFSKSEEEYIAKIYRGMADHKKEEKREFDEKSVYFPEFKYDYSVCRFVTKLYPKIATTEKLRYAWLWLKNIWIKLKHVRA